MNRGSRFKSLSQPHQQMRESPQRARRLRDTVIRPRVILIVAHRPSLSPLLSAVAGTAAAAIGARQRQAAHGDVFVQFSSLIEGHNEVACGSPSHAVSIQRFLLDRVKDGCFGTGLCQRVSQCRPKLHTSCVRGRAVRKKLAPLLRSSQATADGVPAESGTCGFPAAAAAAAKRQSVSLVST